MLNEALQIPEQGTEERVTYAKALALARQGGLSRSVFGKPRGTRKEAAAARVPVPGHYYPDTSAQFVVYAEPFHVEAYLCAMRLGVGEAVRSMSAAVVGEFGDSSCVCALSDVLHDDPVNGFATLEDGTRRSAAFALASIGGPEAENSLWRALERKDYPARVREAALDGLLDLLTPDGWDNYMFMTLGRTRLPIGVTTRLLAVRDDLPCVVDIVAKFDVKDDR